MTEKMFHSKVQKLHKAETEQILVRTHDNKKLCIWYSPKILPISSLAITFPKIKSLSLFNVELLKKSSQLW